ncbi:MAG: WD40 repeat domain-containing protein, partial [Planctomycetales bacterium]|nr:WD40 repeat domain-containing protein [Planctomycetales bacterium]
SNRLSSSSHDVNTAVSDLRRLHPGRLRQLLRGELDWVVMKAIEKDRGRRYETATALAADVQHYLNDEPVTACPPSTAYRLRKFARRNKVRLIATAAMLAMVIVGLFVSTSLVARQRDAAERSARREANAARQAQQRLEDSQYNLYVAQMQMARVDWDEGRLDRMIEALEGWIPQSGERDLRGWEWYYLLSLTRRNLAGLDPGVGQITAVKWSSDQRLLAVSGDMIQVYDSASRHLKFRISDARQFAWRPDSHDLAVTSVRGAVTVWNTDRGEQVRSVGHAAGVSQQLGNRTTWSPDGSRMAVAAGLNLFIWNATDSDEPAVLQIDSRLGAAACLDWSPDSRHIAVGGGFPGWGQVWDAVEGKSILVDWMHRHRTTAVAWSPDGTKLASAALNKDVKIWDTSSWTQVLTLSNVESNPNDLQWSRDSQTLAVAGSDGRLGLWNAETGQVREYLRGHRNPAVGMDWSPDGEQIVAGSVDGAIKFFRPFRPQLYDLVAGDRYGVWSSDGKWFAVCDIAQERERNLSILRSDTLEVVKRFSVDGPLLGLEPSPDGNAIALASRDGVVAVWRWESAELLWEAPKAHRPGEARCVDWSPDGRVLASCGMDRTVKLWDGASGRLLRTLVGHSASLGAVHWSPDGRRLATTDWQGKVKIWNHDTWTVEHEMERGAGLPHGGSNADGQRPIAFSPDGRFLAGGGLMGTVFIWDVASGRELTRMHGHTGNVRTVAWTPDGARLASGAEDGFVKIWDPSRGREVLSLLRGPEWVGTVDWSPDGRRLLSSSVRVMLWDATPAYEIYQTRSLQ